MQKVHVEAPDSITAIPPTTPTVLTTEQANAPHPLNRQYVLTSERQSENAVFAAERSPMELEFEQRLDSTLPNRSPGWTTRSL